jgi:hypothetical protein
VKSISRTCQARSTGSKATKVGLMYGLESLLNNAELFHSGFVIPCEDHDYY